VPKADNGQLQTPSGVVAPMLTAFAKAGRNRLWRGPLGVPNWGRFAEPPGGQSVPVPWCTLSSAGFLRSLIHPT
jgi:hypothetical protein